jgi:hypothetical protein
VIKIFFVTMMRIIGGTDIVTTELVDAG